MKDKKVFRSVREALDFYIKKPLTFEKKMEIKLQRIMDKFKEDLTKS